MVKKIQASLEKVAAEHRGRITLGAVVPASAHRAIIGRGGQNLSEIQNRYGVTIQVPGSRSYHSMGDISNQEELENSDLADIVKVMGTSAACAKAIEELAVSRHVYLLLDIDGGQRFFLDVQQVSIPTEGESPEASNYYSGGPRSFEIPSCNQPRWPILP